MVFAGNKNTGRNFVAWNGAIRLYNRTGRTLKRFEQQRATYQVETCDHKDQTFSVTISLNPSFRSSFLMYQCGAVAMQRSRESKDTSGQVLFVACNYLLVLVLEHATDGHSFDSMVVIVMQFNGGNLRYPRKTFAVGSFDYRTWPEVLLTYTSAILFFFFLIFVSGINVWHCPSKLVTEHSSGRVTQ